MNPDDLLAMSDDDFLKMDHEVTSPTGEVSAVTENDPDTSQESEEEIESFTSEHEETETTVAEEESEEDLAEADEEKEKDDQQSSDSDKTVSTPEEELESKKSDSVTEEPDNKAEKEKAVEHIPTAEEYKSFYDQMMTPFKANGKTIELKDPSEAIQLMKMGANYTWKMQSIAPHRKALLMLENNKLLDEDKLSYLIDLDKKNPEAIKKLIKESGIDPLEIDTNEEPQYQQGNHKVSDEQVSFSSILEDYKSTPEGLATLQVINSSWDNASIDVLGSEPTVINAIHEQRQLGIYDRIANEIERQKVLGKIPSNTPFIHAYRDIGNQMAQSGAFNDIAQSGAKPTVAPQQPVQPQGVRRVASPKPAVTNSDKAKAASTSRSTGKKSATPKINPLALSDEEFMKQMENRV